MEGPKYSEIENYLDSKVKCVLEPVVRSMLNEQPNEPYIYLINYLKRLIGISQDSTEKDELKQLKSEMNHYRKIFNIPEVPKIVKKKSTLKTLKSQYLKELKSQKSMKINKEELEEKKTKENIDKETENYEKEFENINENSILNQFEAAQLEIDVEDEEENDSAAVESEESVDEDEEKDEFDKVIELKKIQLIKKGQRASVSAEAYGIFNQKLNYVPKIIEKTETQKKRINDKVIQSFLFSSLEEQDLKLVIDAMDERSFKAGEEVIVQGQNGDCLYVMETGIADCYKTFIKEKGPIYLKSYYPGESFGELALLYNAPRQASIVAKEDCILWELDRETFNNIVKTSAMKKREKYEKFLKTVDILKSVDMYELCQVADAIRTLNVSEGDNIITQNEKGDKFFLIEEGTANAVKVFNEGEEPVVVLQYKKGDYFGELALIKNAPRAASVVATSDCKLLTIDRLTFKRLLGPIENILKRNSDNYLKYMNK